MLRMAWSLMRSISRSYSGLRIISRLWRIISGSESICSSAWRISGLRSMACCISGWLVSSAASSVRSCSELAVRKCCIIGLSKSCCSVSGDGIWPPNGLKPPAPNGLAPGAPAPGTGPGTPAPAVAPAAAAGLAGEQ